MPERVFSPQPGDTLLCKHFFEPTSHLWIVLTAPAGDPPKIAIVSVTTKRPRSDTTVVLRPPDHPFIDWESVVSYKDAMFASVDDLREQVDDEIATPCAPFEAPVFERIRNGVQESPFTPRGIKKHCAKVWS